MPRPDPPTIFICWILKLLGDTHALAFLQVDWNKVEERLNSIKRRGKPDSYPRVYKFRILFWGYIHNTRSPTQIVKSVKTNPFARLALGWKIPSHDVITDCLNSYNPIMDQLFTDIVNRAVKMEIVQTTVQIQDPTSIATKFKKSDKDAKWNVKKGGKKPKYYFGYGLDARIDPFSHLPISVLFIQSKKTDEEQTKILHWKSPYCEIYLADSEFDMIDWTELLMDAGTLPVVRYNRRRGGSKKIKYRIQEYTNEIGVRWLKELSKIRTEIEHQWSTEKERFGLEDIHVRGWEKVETHAYLCLISRYADALAVHKYHPEESVRRSLASL